MSIGNPMIPAASCASPKMASSKTPSSPRRLGEQVLETGSQQRRIDQIEHVADVIVGGDFRDPEQGLAVRLPLAFLKGALERQKRRALHEKQGEGRQTEICHRDIAATPLRGVGKIRAYRAQTSKKGWQEPSQR
jgi:hypothetical protein